MKFKQQSFERSGAFKGAFAASGMFLLGIGSSIFFLSRKYEERIEKIEKETAITCLDFAANYYERVIRRHNVMSENMVPPKPRTALRSAYAEFLRFQCELDAAGHYEPSDEEWEVLEKEVEQTKAECEAQRKEAFEEQARIDIEFERAKLKLLAEKAQELAGKEIDFQQNQSGNKL